MSGLPNILAIPQVVCRGAKPRVDSDQVGEEETKNGITNVNLQLEVEKVGPFERPFLDRQEHTISGRAVIVLSQDIWENSQGTQRVPG